MKKTDVIAAPKTAFDKASLAAITARLNALSQMRVTLTIEGVPVTGFVRVVNDAADLRLDVSGITISGYAPANAAVLENLDENDDGILTYGGVQIGSDGLTQAEVTWAASMVIDFAGDKVRRIFVQDSTSFTFAGIAKAREVYLILVGGGTPKALSWQSGIDWAEGSAPTTLPAGKTMRVHIYSSGTTTSELLATRNGGY